MKLPHKVRITAKQAYEIFRVPRFENPDNLGECRLKSKQIGLVDELKGKELIKSAIHEILHAISEEYEIKIPHNLIYELEEPLYKVLKLNGWIK